MFVCGLTRGLSINPKQKSFVLIGIPQTNASTENLMVSKKKKLIHISNSITIVHTNPTNFVWNYSWFKRNDNCSPGTLSIYWRVLLCMVISSHFSYLWILIALSIIPFSALKLSSILVLPVLPPIPPQHYIAYVFCTNHAFTHIRNT